MGEGTAENLNQEPNEITRRDTAGFGSSQSPHEYSMTLNDY